MSMFKKVLQKRNKKTLMENSDYSKLAFQYVESDTIQDKSENLCKKKEI